MQASLSEVVSEVLMISLIVNLHFLHRERKDFFSIDFREITAHWLPAQFSLFVERRDESALLNLFDVGWIDNQVRIGLLCLRILIRKYFQRSLDDLRRRDRYRF